MAVAPAWRALLLATLVGGSAMALRPLGAGQGPENWFSDADKLFHFGYFAALWCLAERARLATPAWRATALLSFGLGIEVAQHLFTATRGMSFADLVADAAGLIVGAALMRWASGRKPQEHGG